jgi:hypothetical protein
MKTFRRIIRWWKRQLFGEWLSTEECLDRVADRGLTSLDNCLNIPPIIIFGVFDGNKVHVRAYRRDDVPSNMIEGLGPELSRCAARFLEKV